jgi:hypothetical protein
MLGTGTGTKKEWHRKRTPVPPWSRNVIGNGTKWTVVGLKAHLVNVELPGNVVPLREEAQLYILLVDVHPHAEIVEELTSLLPAKK